MQRRTLTKFWGSRDTKEHVLGLLNEWLKTLSQVPPDDAFVQAAVQHIRVAMPRVGATLDTDITLNFWTVGSRWYGVPLPV